MIPWPIAAMCLVYAAIAASSGATVWKIVCGELSRSPVWPVTWWLVSSALVGGLALMKPWARTIAIIASVLMTVGALGSAVLAVLPADPDGWGAILATCLAGGHLIIIRYLSRPQVKAWFITGIPVRNQ